MNFRLNNYKKGVAVVTCFSILFLSFSPLFARKAEALFGIFDIVFAFETNPALVVSAPVSAAANTVTAINTTLAAPVKEFGLDTIAWMLVNIIIERLAASTINWINNGFKGSPAFVTDPEGYFKNIADQTAGQVIFNHPDLRFMCAPLRAKVQIALAQNYISPYNYQCTLSDVGRNFDNFMNDFNQGGWDNFIEISQNSQNNPLGLYNQLNNQINVSVGSALGQKQQELNWGNGFLSWKSCAQWSDAGVGYDEGARRVFGGTDAEGNEEYIETPPRRIEGSPPTCISSKVNTPGSVISEQLNTTLGIGSDRLKVADEINEIISALLNQLAGRIIGGVGKGLRALGGNDNNGTSTSYWEQLKNASLTSDIPMPANGQCPDYYVAMSLDRCGTNDLIRQSFIDARDAEARAIAAIAEEKRLAEEAAARAAANACPFDDPTHPACASIPGAPPPVAPPPVPPPPRTRPPLVCPTDFISALPSPILLVGQYALLVAPVGWTGGSFSSTDSTIALLSGPYVTGKRVGSTYVSGSGFTAPNGASPCALTAINITVN